MMRTNENLARVVSFPANSETSAEQPKASPRLLIVDDIADNRTILARRFSRRGFEIVEADGGARALELIDQQSFDVVLLDVMMPEIDGIEVLKTVRRTHSAQQLPIIMVTAKSESENVVEALKLEANDYITKPVDFDVALARVNTQVERKKSEDKIQSANRALRHINDELERRVEERTRSLVAINQQLQSEIEQREKSEAHSRFLAFHDPLTGLPNRRMFREELAEGIARKKERGRNSITVLFLDLDGFKGVNDSLGHSVGDLLLQAIAKDFCSALTGSDRIARLGGDEFAILQLDDNQPSAAIGLAQRLIEIAGRERQIHGHQINAGASVGIVVSSEGNEDSEHLLKSADLAMYRAKIEGRGTYRLYNPAMDATIQARRLLELDLRTALARNEFEVFYQPQVQLRTREVKGFEALIRWRHPERGMVSPLEFIALAEEIGLIIPIGDWVLREACKEAMRWPNSVSVAVNVSSVQFTRGGLVASVMNALAASGLPPHRLEIEVTESVLLRKTEQNVETLNQLRALGVRISMDDFGTGYSSLSYLRLFSFDKLKIDKSFVDDVTTSKDSKAIVNAILRLGASFGIPTTAEGVETEDQLKHLGAEGCSEIQGRIFAMPLETDQIDDFIAKHRPSSTP